jgi:major membrane immunogen (membrane-anchored lipoprotein)
MTAARLFALSLAALLVTLAGCGSSSPKTVTKAQYQAQLTKSGQAITIAGQQLGKVITIAEFNGAVSDLQKALRDGEKNLKDLQPPANTRAPNKQLAQAFGDLADALEAVKEARRVSIVKARDALGKLGGSPALKNGRAAIQKLNQLGYAVDAATP